MLTEQGAPEGTNNQSSRVAAIIASAAIALGVSLRVLEFLRDRPLWLDEAMLALNIAARPLAQLARPLDYDQTGPLLYLWIERLVVVIGGVSERSLRVLPFVAGLALLPAIWFMARRLAGMTAAAIAVVLASLSLALVSFSAEAKQYGVDPLVAAALAWLAVRVSETPADRRVWLQLTIVGLPSLLLSQPARFTLGAVTLALAAERTVRESRPARRFGLIAGAAWASMFAALYFTLYRGTANSTYMRSFWEGTFLNPAAPDFLLRLRMFFMAAFSAPTLTGTLWVPEWVMAIAWLGGVVTLWRRRAFVGLLASLPILLAACASAIGAYAVMDRLFLFTTPFTAMAYASLLAAVVERAPQRSVSIALGGVCAALALVVGETHARRITHPVFNGVGKQVVADVDSMSRGEPVYIAARSFPLWMFYTTDWRAPDESRLRWAASIAGAGGPAHNNAPSRGHVRADEARLLARPYHGRLERVGTPTGRQYRTSSRTLNATLSPADYALPLQPDSGWAELEVNRMSSAAHDRLWVFGSHMFSLDGAEGALVAELQRRNVRLAMERRQGSTVAYQVEFPSQP
jgi:hypothetical protein